MYYSYVEIEYVATSFSPAKTDLAVKLFRIFLNSLQWLLLDQQPDWQGFIVANPIDGDRGEAACNTSIQGKHAVDSC